MCLNLSIYYSRFAAQHNVSLTTFDNEMELQKFKKFYPAARLVIMPSLFILFLICEFCLVLYVSYSIW